MMGSFGGRRCVLLVLFTTVVADSRFLWIYQQSGMGFGDKMNFYYNGAAIAKALQRTLILPPIEIHTTNYTAISEVDVVADGIEAFRAAHPNAHSSWAYKHEEVFVPFDRFFRVDSVATAGELEVVTHEAWIDSSSSSTGRVDYMLIPSAWHGCLPMYDDLCRVAALDSKLRWQLEDPNSVLPDRVYGNESVMVAAAACNYNFDQLANDAHWSSTEHATAFVAELGGSTSPARNLNPKDDDRAQFQLERAHSALTLGLSGWCLRFNFAPGLRATADTVQKHGIRFRDNVEAAATLWLRQKELGRFAAVHWRRSDVLLDHYDNFGKFTPEYMIKALQAFSEQHLSGISDLLLVTDNFVVPELTRFKQLAKSELGLRVHRFNPYSEKNVPILSMLPDDFVTSEGIPASTMSVAQVQSLFMDIALASHADVLLVNYPASNYGSFIQAQRVSHFGRSWDTFLDLSEHIHTDL